MKQKSEQNELQQLQAALAALDNPHRLRIIAVLQGGRMHVSGLARALELSRPLVHMHLQRLEGAGLVRGSLELSADGKAMKYFDVEPFAYALSPELIARLVDDIPPRAADTPEPKKDAPT